ncbi:MAG: LysR family transcriptional regulator [Oscillospiraceae bacterium]|nr:LysR family transcriptional regulator [Oscillospiraceae bacterium]
MALEGRGLHTAQLRYFTTIAQPENVSQAAQLLHLSQSSLSKNLAKLAAELRTPLFDHSGKRLTLNPAFIGKYFPNSGIRLRECADRTQGLMPPPGTPWASVVWRTCSGMGCDTSTARKALAPGFSSTTCAKGTAWIRRGSTAMTGRSLLTPPWPPRSPPAPLTRAWASSRRPNSTARTCCPRA